MEKSDISQASELIAIYQSLLGITQKMLAHAKHEEWDEIAPLENQRAKLIENLKTIEGASPSPETASLTVDLIRQILSTDEETRALCSDWMGELRSILDSIDAKKKINKAYSL